MSTNQQMAITPSFSWPRYSIIAESTGASTFTTEDYDLAVKVLKAFQSSFEFETFKIFDNRLNTSTSGEYPNYEFEAFQRTARLALPVDEEWLSEDVDYSTPNHTRGEFSLIYCGSFWIQRLRVERFAFWNYKPGDFIWYLSAWGQTFYNEDLSFLEKKLFLLVEENHPDLLEVEGE